MRAEPGTGIAGAASPPGVPDHKGVADAPQLDIECAPVTCAQPGHELVRHRRPQRLGQVDPRPSVGDHSGIAVVEVDDFYLPSARRVAVPRVPGQNVDLARLAQQVLVPGAAGWGARYQRYDWDRDVLGFWVDIAPGTALLVEGTYSTRASVCHWFALRVWVESPYVVRLARGVARDGEEMRTTWTDEWMPAEDRYIDAEDPVSHAHLVVDGSGLGDPPRYGVHRSSIPAT